MAQSPATDRTQGADKILSPTWHQEEKRKRPWCNIRVLPSGKYQARHKYPDQLKAEQQGQDDKANAVLTSEWVDQWPANMAEEVEAGDTGYLLGEKHGNLFCIDPFSWEQIFREYHLPWWETMREEGRATFRLPTRKNLTPQMIRDAAYKIYEAPKPQARTKTYIMGGCYAATRTEGMGGDAKATVQTPAPATKRQPANLGAREQSESHCNIGRRLQV